MRPSFLFLISLALCFAQPFTERAWADLINVTAAQASSNNGGSAIASANGVGLGAQYPAFPTTHTGANVDGWIGHGSATDSDPWVHYDFGIAQELTAMRFWNYNATSNQTRNIRDLDIYYSNDTAAYGVDNHSSWTLVNSLTDLDRGATSNGGTVNTPYGTQYELNNVTTRFIRFDIVDTYGAQPAFAEVQFLSVPEPAGFGIALAGFCVSLTRRRRQA